MSYTITRANGTNPIVIADGTTDVSTSITLVGKNTPNYGQFLDQNFLNMLENFANSTQPNNAITGQIWYDTKNSVLKVYNGTFFKNIASATNASPPGPLNAVTGDLWWDNVNNQLNCYSGTGWVIIGPLGGAGQVVSEILYDTASGAHNVISMKINNARYVVLSKDAQFTPNVNISGFSTISPGLNIASTSFVSNNKFVGQASDSAALGGVTSTSFMRSDTNTSTSGTLSVVNNAGISLGATNQSTFSMFSNELRLENVLNNGIIRLRTRNNIGGVVDALDVLANGDVQVNNLIVNGNLDVTTSNETSIVFGTAAAYNTTSGAFQVVGGVGIGGNIISGGTNNAFTGNVYVANLIANGSSNNGNVYATAIQAGTIGNIGTSLIGTVTTATQSSITSVGTLTSLAVNGTTALTGAVTFVSGGATFNSGSVTFNPTSAAPVTLGNVGNVKISGGASTYILQTDGSSNLTWVPSPIGTSGTSGYFGIYSNATAIAANSGVRFDGSNVNITGGLTATADIVAYYSDARLKTDIVTIPSALEKVKAIRGVTYKPNELAFELGVGDNNEHIGVLAQEVQAVAPQVIKAAPFDISENGTSISGQNYLTVQYDKLVPLLIEAIKELSAELEALKARGS
jgi:hypothetical protein